MQAIRKNRMEAKLPDIFVTTIDASQGLGSDIVIVSATRNRRARNNLFSNDRKRINVMLSRARERLVLIAAVNDLKEMSTEWSEMFAIIAHQRDVEREEKKNSPERDEEFGFYIIDRYDTFSVLSR